MLNIKINDLRVNWIFSIEVSVTNKKYLVKQLKKNDLCIKFN